ncbi:hypothetical protein Pla108_26590 [Botrimarina colliarenosi]|uniref:Uncharacterized protein n=1 Tax=Botrimarina colliarenosi TaxID=2528001 RepID=A0A5C6AA37_9BACT|nr:DUF3365 domain-containing protein [Botrimarina colliarenosi]TWT96884.1 hypothetical protein Pla108_26590 [Botrimarina colliarenosi]
MSEMEAPAKPTTWRLTIGGLLVFTAFAAFLAVPITKLGQIYVVVLIVSSLLLLVAAISFRYGRTFPVVLASVLTPFAPLLVFLLSPVLFLQGFLTGLTSVLTIGWRPYPARRLAACGLAMLLAYSYGFFVAWKEGSAISAMREKYALVSLVDRLPNLSTEPMELPPIQLTQQQAADLAMDDKIAGGNTRRKSSLQRLHSDRYLAFTRAQGFGVTRLNYIDPARIETQTDELLQTAGRKTPIDLFLTKADAPQGLHRRMLRSFLDPERLGYVENKLATSGFLGHAIGLDSDDFTRGQDLKYLRIDRLELVGLLMHDKPVAYISTRLPDMEELRSVPTRDLDEFESAALEKLYGQEDVVVDEQLVDGKMHARMLGAVRAGKSCAACHEVPHGTLFGAFSYDLAYNDAPGSGEPTMSGEP